MNVQQIFISLPTAGRHPYAEYTLNNDRMLILDTPRTRRPAFNIAHQAQGDSFLQPIPKQRTAQTLPVLLPFPSRGSVVCATRRFTGACRLRASDIFAANLPLGYTVNRMARRKRAGLFPAYVNSSGACNLDVAIAFKGCLACVAAFSRRCARSAMTRYPVRYRSAAVLYSRVFLLLIPRADRRRPSLYPEPRRAAAV